jgi:hypothetical protein
MKRVVFVRKDEKLRRKEGSGNGIFFGGGKVRLARLSPSAPYFEMLVREASNSHELAYGKGQLAVADRDFAEATVARGVGIDNVGVVTQVFGDGWVTVKFDVALLLLDVSESLLEEVVE